MPDRAALLRAAAANHRAFFRRYGKLEGRRVERIDGVEVVLGAGSGTIAFPGPRGRSAPRLDEIVRRARALGAERVSCWSLDEDRVLGTLLIARGFEWGWEPHWMALDLSTLPESEPGHEVFRFAADAARPDQHVPYADPVSDPPSVHHLGARVDGETVGHVIVNPWRRFAGIYAMGVAESRRRRGIGRAMTIAACRLGRQVGCGHAVLNATPEGELLYRTLGFESLGFGQTWWRHPGRWPTARQTALVEAIGLGGVEAFAALRPTRAELERPIPGPGPPLVVTANTRAAAVADWILTRRPELVRRRFEPRGETLLHLAVEGDDEVLLRVALGHGADPSARDRTHGGTPLGWARHQGRPELAALLQQAGG